MQGQIDNVGREEAVTNYLIEKGISETMIFAKGYGEVSSVEYNDTGRGRALNRRVFFNLISNLNYNSLRFIFKDRPVRGNLFCFELVSCYKKIVTRCKRKKQPLWYGCAMI